MRLKYLFLGIILLSVFGCGEDAGVSGDNVIHYDGANATSPALPPGLYIAAARFNTTLLRNVEGKNIEAISFYMYDIPRTVKMTISYDETASNPDSPVFEQDITNQLSGNTWNTINLTSPFAIDGSALWIAIEMNILSPQQSIGCDAGPANPNGDWLFDAADSEWLKFEERVGDSINWNIRAVLSQ